MDGLGARLKECARALGLTDVEVARRAGLRTPRYAHYVSGLREPDLETLVKIARVLGVTPNDLLAFESTDEKEPLAEKRRLLSGFVRAMDTPTLDLTVTIAHALAATTGLRSPSSDEIARRDNRHNAARKAKRVSSSDA